MTIRFDEKPSEAVRKLVKEEHSYRFDGEDKVWYKRINPAQARQVDRQELGEHPEHRRGDDEARGQVDRQHARVPGVLALRSAQALHKSRASIAAARSR